MRTVAAVVDQGALTFDFAIPCEVFGLDRSDIVDPWYEFLVVAAGDRRVRMQTGFELVAPHGLEALAGADTIVVPGWSDPDDDPSEALKRELVAAHARGARIMSLCTGAFVLAAAGLLDGRRATTHWMYAERLRRRFPLIDLDPDVLYVVDGNVMTSAGTAAGIDLCLHVVALDHGVEVAATVARRLVCPSSAAVVRPSTSTRRSSRPKATGSARCSTGEGRTWARDCPSRTWRAKAR